MRREDTLREKLKELLSFTVENPRKNWDNEFALITERDLLFDCAHNFLNGTAESVAIVNGIDNDWHESIFDCAHAILFLPDDQPSIIFYMHDRGEILQAVKDMGGKLIIAYSLS